MNNCILKDLFTIDFIANASSLIAICKAIIDLTDASNLALYEFCSSIKPKQQLLTNFRD